MVFEAKHLAGLTLKSLEVGFIKNILGKNCHCFLAFEIWLKIAMNVLDLPVKDFSFYKRIVCCYWEKFLQ